MAEITITKENFKQEVQNAEVPVLLDFWATWCGPCRMVAPELQAVAEELGSSIKVGKINVDEQPELAEQFNISSIPALFVLKNGKVTATAVGYREKPQILALLEQ